MRQFLLSLMVLVMFTPGLACARFMPQQKAPASHMHMAADMPCCPKPKVPHCDGLFMKDCMHIDLQHSMDGPLLKKADIQKHSPALALSDAIGKSFGSVMSRVARGPPPERQVAFTEPQPLYLATLRLRI